MAIHFICFRDDRYTTDVRIFGPPDFFHRYWDQRAKAEIVEGDIAVFAKGTDADPPNPFAFIDSEIF